MAEYRNRTTGEIKNQGELRRDNPNISMPKVWNQNVYDALNVDLILPSSPPSEGIGIYQKVERNGAVQNSDGNWVEAWQIVDMFSDDAELGTKAEQEAAYDSVTAEQKKLERQRLLSETDWWALSDTATMTAEQTAYRQALRDITSHANWPHLEDADWPTKPS